MSHRERLAELGKKRRLELGRKQTEVATLAGIARKTVVNLEAGIPVKEWILYKYDRGVDWQNGSAAAVLAGGDPIEIPDEPGEPNWPPAEIPATVVERYKPAPGEHLRHPEDIEAWSLDISEEERRWLVGYRRAFRAGEHTRRQQRAT